MHSPLPWKHSLTDDTVVIDATGNEVAAIDGDYNQPDLWPIMEANAAFIVKAANCHDALVAALKLTLAEALTFHATLMKNDRGIKAACLAPAIAKARAALALAGGEG